MKNMFFGAVLALLLMLGGCAATVQGAPGGSPSPGQSPPSATSAAPAGHLYLVVQGSSKATSSTDWGDLLKEWRVSVGEAAAAGGLAFTMLDSEAQVPPQRGTLVVVKVDDYRYVRPASRFLFGIMTGNAYLNTEATFYELPSQTQFDKRAFNTTSSAMQGIFSAMTDRQIKAIGAEMVQVIRARPQQPGAQAPMPAAPPMAPTTAQSPAPMPPAPGSVAASQPGTAPLHTMTNRPLRAGDTFEYKVQDRVGRKSSNVVLRVDRADGAQATFNAGARVESQSGEVVQVATALLGELDMAMPPGGWMQGGVVPKSGSRFTFESPDKRFRYRFWAEPSAPQVMQTPIGSVQVVRIDLDGHAFNQAGLISQMSGRYRGTVWLAPELRRVVRFEANGRGAGNSGGTYFQIDEVVELVRIGSAAP